MNKKLKKSTRVKQRSYTPKKVATPEEINLLSTAFNIFSPQTTPLDIYSIRQGIYRDLSNYENKQEIYYALLHPEKYGITVNPDDPDGLMIIPLDRMNPYPGYMPVRGGVPGFLEDSVTGYAPVPNSIPEGAIPTADLSWEAIHRLNEEGNLFRPDFQNTFLFYTYPTQAMLSSPSTEHTTLVSYNPTLDKSNLTFTPDELDEQDEIYPLEYYQELPVDINTLYSDAKYRDLWEDLYNYVKEHDFFNYVDPRIGQVLDLLHWSPNQLRDWLNSLYQSDKLPEEITDEDIDTPEYEEEYYPSVKADRHKRLKIVDPVKSFSNLSDDDKIKYDVQKELKRSRWDSTPSWIANTLMDYEYAMLHPELRLKTVFPDIPLLDLKYDTVTGRYKVKK